MFRVYQRRDPEYEKVLFMIVAIQPIRMAESWMHILPEAEGTPLHTLK